MAKKVNRYTPKLRTLRKVKAYSREYKSNKPSHRWVIFKVLRNGDHAIIGSGATAVQAWEKAARRIHAV